MSAPVYKYMILTTIPADNDPCWDDVVPCCVNVRKSLDGTKCIVKWLDGPTPASLPANTVYTEATLKTHLDANPADWGERNFDGTY